MYYLKIAILTLQLAWLISLNVEAGDASLGAQKISTCVACHGQTGVSPTPIWPNLAGQGEQYLIKQITDIKNNLRPVPTMTAFVSNLSNDDISDIAAFYASQPAAITGTAERPNEVYELSAEQFLDLGEKIYRSGNAELKIPACTACHSPTGNGNAPASYPKIGGQHYDYLVLQLKGFRGNLRKNDGESKVMRNAVENLKDIELEAVANYISGLH